MANLIVTIEAVDSFLGKVEDISDHGAPMLAVSVTKEGKPVTKLAQPSINVHQLARKANKVPMEVTVAVDLQVVQFTELLPGLYTFALRPVTHPSKSDPTVIYFVQVTSGDAVDQGQALAAVTLKPGAV